LVVRGFSKRWPRDIGKDTFSEAVMNLADLLDRHNAVIGFFFSVLGFVDAFVTAQDRGEKFLLKEEKSQVFSASDPPDKNRTKWWETANFVYYRSMLLQLLLLPVRFYYLLFYSFDRLATGRLVDDLDGVNETVTFAVANADDEIKYEIFSTRSKISLLFPSSAMSL